MGQIYNVIKEFLLEKGYPPSVREIGKSVGLKSSSTVHGYLNQLEEAGLIRRDPTKPRAIDLLEDKPWERTVNVPLVGAVTAGTPILAQENIEEVFAFPQSLLGTTSETFMLKVDGDSMINAGIYDGDYIMVRQQNTANNSDIVVALVNGEAATVKRFFREKDYIRLQPENDSMEPFYERNVTILGKVIGVYRQM
ncbi:transcriptional repressor LexA [Anaerovibrio sp.]|uniref:transcriptional repressor LexA n=1 Tax=Anaerovibrio sp. TaxID=1872532 RepID=UPI0025E7EC60|nr:transcriptional repressor LexA [Anaerovibrio sp.]